MTPEQISETSFNQGDGSWSFSGRAVKSRNVDHSQTWKQSASTGLKDQNEEVVERRTERMGAGGGTKGRGAGILGTAVETGQSQT